MSAMDQAFFKAYRHQGPLPPGEDGQVSLAEALEDRPLREAKTASAAARLEGVLEALSATSSRPVEKPPANQADEAATEPASTADDIALGDTYNRVPEFLRPVKAAPKKTPAAMTAADAKLDLPILHGPHGQADPVCHGPHQRPSHDDSLSGAVLTAAKAQGAAVAEPPAETDAADTTSQQPVDGPSQQFLDDLDAISDEQQTQPDPLDKLPPLRPMLQVDCFEWPEVCMKLADLAGETLDELGDALLRMTQQGHKIIGLTAALPKQGVTTLLLTLARTMSLRQMNVFVVDAALRSPCLASRVGIGPEYGWEDLAVSQMPLEEYLIESIADELVLMPFCGSIEDEAEVPELLEPFGAALGRLRAHGDLVLVDLGTQLPDQTADPLVLARAVDTILIVRDARHPVNAKQLALHRRLSRAGVTVAGTIETFS